MAVDHLESRWQFTFLTELLVPLCQSIQKPLTQQSPRPAGCRIVRAYGLKIPHNGDHIVIRQREMLHIQYWRTKTGTHQGIADIVHIDEPADMHMVRIDS